jgi:hypothetical protein
VGNGMAPGGEKHAKLSPINKSMKTFFTFSGEREARVQDGLESGCSSCDGVSIRVRDQNT